MAAYGRGQTLGSGINPESFKQDFSGFARAAQIQAQGMANLGAQIGQATGDYFKQQNEKKKAIKQASTQIESALNLFPDLKSTFGDVQNRLRDDDIPLSERAAEAETIAGLINMGVTKLRDQAEKDLQMEKINASRGAAGKPFTLKPELLNVGGGFVAVKTGSDGNYYDESGQFPITNMQAYIGGEPPESYSSFAASVPNYGSEGDLPAGMIEDGAPMVLPVEGFGNNVDPAAIDYAASLGGAQATPADIQGAQMVSPVVGEPPASIAEPQSAPARRSRLIQKDAESSVPAGSEMTMEQYNNLVAQGQNIKGVPLSNGNVFVTAMQPFAPQQGQEIITNADGTTVRSIVVGKKDAGSDLNKSPTTQLKEGEVLVADPNSPTGTRIVQVPSEMREKAKNDFSSYVAQVGDSYARLDQLGKAVSAGEFNPLNYVFATEVGQTMARAFGEQGQPLREQINTMAPNIINVIRQSTQMGSKGMDSNAEREFYIKAMGDPKLPIEANIKALDVLDKVYGNGNAVKEMLKNYPELKSKVNKYQLNWSPSQSGKSSTPAIEGAASNDEIYKRHLK